MGEQKTRSTEESVENFIEKIPDKQVRDDCNTLIKLMKKITGSAPKMWVGQYCRIWEISLQV
jgi:hypothetical protein